MTTILLARHGETDWNRDGRFQGQADPPLNDTGRAQAAGLGASLAGDGISAIYSSDLRRAADTAGIVAERVGLAVTMLPDLREADVGPFTGLTRDEIARHYPEESRRANEHGYTFVVGEGFEALERRVLAALRRIGEAHDGGIVLVVTHGGPIRAVLAHADEIGVDEHRRRFAPALNSSVYRLSVTDGILRRID